MHHSGVEGGQLWAAAGPAMLGPDAASAVAAVALLLRQYTEGLPEPIGLSDLTTVR